VTSEDGRAPVSLILADTALELVPRRLTTHPSVQSSAQKQGRDPSRILLDSSFHHRAMRGLDDHQRRGRPDIAHFCALLAQGSRMAQAGRLRLFIHTYIDEVVWVAPETRLPRVYDRFKGLMEQLFTEGAVPKDEPLLRLEDGGLKELLERLEPSRTVLLTPSAKRTTFAKLFPAKKRVDGAAVAIGGFAHSEFRAKTAALFSEHASVADEAMEAWAIEGELLHRLADVDGLK